MLEKTPTNFIFRFFLAGLFLWFFSNTSAAENILQKIEHLPQGKKSTLLTFHSQAPPDFEIFENLPKKVFIIKFRNTNIADLQKLQIFRGSLINVIQLLKVDAHEHWVKIKTSSPDILYKILGRRDKNSGTLSVLFSTKEKKLVEEPGIKITSILRELNPESEIIIIFSEKPLQHDVALERNKPGKLMNIRLLNAKQAKNLIIPGAETDILKYIKVEKRGKYLNLILAPQKYVLRIKKTMARNPIRLIFTVSENKAKLVTDADLDLEAVEEKKEEEDLEKQRKDRFMTKLFNEAEKFYKAGRFSQASQMYKNIYNFAPKTEIGVRANFRAADSHFQQQRKNQELGGEQFVIQEYKSAINSALVADLGYENIPSAYYNIGRNYYDLRFYEDAFNQFEIILQKYPESPYSKDSLFYQGVIHLNMERYQKSIESLERFVEENTKSPKIHIAYYKIGESQFQLQKYLNAKKNFDKAWSLNAGYMKEDAELMFHMGEAYFENQDYQTARDIYEQLVDLYPTESFSNLVAIRIGDFLREENKEDDAIKAYEKAINKYPQELSLIGKMRIANILAEKPEENQYKKGLAIYSNIIDRYPYSDQYEEAMLRKALTLSLFHQYAEAISDMEGFCGKFPENIYVKNNIIHARILETIKRYIADYYYQEKYLDALGVYEQYEQKYYTRPHYSTCYMQKKNGNMKEVVAELIKKAPLFHIADSYYRLGLKTEALQINKIILENPDDPLASVVLFNQGKIYEALEQPEKAQQVYLKFINLYPEHTYTPQVKKTLGDSNLKVHKSDRISKAIRYYKATIKDYQDSDSMLEREIIPSCWFALGNLYQNIGRYDESINAYKNVIATYEHPLQSEYVDEIVVNTHFILGNLYLELSQLPEAMENYHKAIQLFPDSDQTPWAKYHIGDIHLKNNQKDQALKIFGELSELAKKNPDALWGPMAEERHSRILNDLKFDKYLSRVPGSGISP